jgi:uracil-DNA glycosylase
LNHEAVIHTFYNVINCEACNSSIGSILVRDKLINLPQPGYIGKNYEKFRVLLIGQNPGVCPPSRQLNDRKYMQALLNLAVKPSIHTYKKLYQILLGYIPGWSVNRKYFPLEECGLGLDDIAYCNVVRCRTQDNIKPSKTVTDNCIREHLFNFIDLVDPKVIVYIGKWAHDQVSPFLKSRKIPMTYMNRDRSLSSNERDANRKEVIKIVLDAIRVNGFASVMDVT